MTEIDHKVIIEQFRKISSLPPDQDFSWADVDFAVAAAKNFLLEALIFGKPTHLANLCDEIDKTWQRVQFSPCANENHLRYKTRLEFLWNQSVFIKTVLLPKLKARKMIRRDYWRFRILEKMRSTEKITAKNISIATNLKLGTVLSILRELKSADFIKQVSNNGHVTITPEGIAYYNEIADMFAMSKMVASH